MSAPTGEPGRASLQYEYDVAFSFLAQDEALAERLDNLVSTTLKSFLYSKRQGEIVGTDGEVTFNKVFGTQARVVVVLYRRGWGETPFTRIEQTAIQNRGFSKGYDFVLMIPLDQPPTAPPWMPKTRIWYDLARFGESTAAAIIEERVRDAGGELKPETPEGHLAQLAEDLTAEHRRQGIRKSEVGVKMAHEEVSSLFRELERIAEASRLTGPHVQTQRFPQGGLTLVLRAEGVACHVSWENQYANTLDVSGLFVRFAVETYRLGTSPPGVSKTRYDFDVTKGQQPAWRRAYNKDELSTKQLAEEIVRNLSAYVRRSQKL
jgi:hypothetical protein